MTINEMLETLREGKAVTCDDGRYMKIEDGRFVERSLESGRVVITSSRIFISIDEVLRNETNYRIYKKPILTDKEKEYLGAVIKPFRNKLDVIRRMHTIDKNYDKISFIFKPNNKGEVSAFSLPEFKHGTMYNDMKIDKFYTLEELGL